MKHIIYNLKSALYKSLVNIYITLSPNAKKILKSLRQRYTDSDVNVVWMLGGLGNQILQYIFSRWLEEETSVPCILDDSGFLTYNLHSYELENAFHKTNISAKTSDFYSPSQRFRSLGSSYTLNKLIIKGLRIKSIRTVSNTDYDTISILNDKNPTYYKGYWVTSRFFDEYKEIFYKELEFKPITDPVNKQYERLIRQSYSVGIHIRRKDFVDIGLAPPVDYYAEHISRALSLAPDDNVTLFIFSDDLDWCRAYADALGLPENSTVFVEGNNVGNNYIDMYLMSICNALIVAPKSTFSGVAAMLNRNDNFFVINHEDNVIR